MRRCVVVFTVACILFIAEFALAQVKDELILRIDTLEFRSSKFTLTVQEEGYFFFPSVRPQAIFEVRFVPTDLKEYTQVKIQPSSDFELLDSLILLDRGFWRTRVRFKDLDNAVMPSIILKLKGANGMEVNREYKLHPYSIPVVWYEGEVLEMFEGEEKTVDLNVRFPARVAIPESWNEINKIEYRFLREGQALKIRLRAKTTGRLDLVFPLQSDKPFLGDSAKITRNLAPLKIPVVVKPSRLQFLNPDKPVVFFQLDARNGEEISLPYNTGLQLRQLYRIENQMEGTGRLIAELIPKSIIGDRMLCDIIPYALHQPGDGYLYIKDKGKGIFVTNVNIANRPRVERIKLLREGEDWTDNLRVFPGDKVEVRIEGSGLAMADFQFEGCVSRRDSLRKSAQMAFFVVEIPKNIQRRRVSIFLNQTITPYELIIQEHQNPKPLDFVRLNYDGEEAPMSDSRFDKSVFYPKTMRALTLHFDPSQIDLNGELFGRQFVDVEIKIIGPRNELLDVQRMTNVAVCPGEGSMRKSFYDQRSCFNGVINLNDLLLRKTYDLDPFSQVVVTVNHTQTRYNSSGFTRKATFIMEREYNYDIQISFPAGLLVKNFNQSGVGNLSGISTAAIAQWSWYDPDHIGKFRPFKVGVGFIAFNAFNFNNDPNVQRDVGVVALGSFEPVRTSKKIAVPLYFGIGYQLNRSTMFVLLGPGIQLRF